jgi:hypothetical protein
VKELLHARSRSAQEKEVVRARRGNACSTSGCTIGKDSGVHVFRVGRKIVYLTRFKRVGNTQRCVHRNIHHSAHHRDNTGGRGSRVFAKTLQRSRHSWSVLLLPCGTPIVHRVAKYHGHTRDSILVRQNHRRVWRLRGLFQKGG